MCYLPPGPRCSHHAHQGLVKAERAANAEKDINRKLLLQEKVTQAQKVFYSTPRGQTELSRSIALLTTEAKTDDSKLSELTALKISLRDGEITRTNQLAAYAVFKEKKESNVKEALQTGSKQELAVGITFQHLMSEFEKTYQINAHIIQKDLIKVQNSSKKELFKIVCIQQKYQTILDVAQIENSGLSFIEKQPSSVDVDAVQKALQAYDTFTSIPPETATMLQNWVIDKFIEKNILFISSVDVRTENVKLYPIENLFKIYDLNFKKKKKLGGTSAYRFGKTVELQEELKNTIFHKADIKQVITGVHKQTYLMNAPIATKTDTHTEHFFFAVHYAEAGEPYYEVRVRHISTQFNIFLSLNRTNKVLSTTNLTEIKSVLTEHARILS